MGLILEVVYASPAGLRHDYDTQLRVGGLYARLRVPPGLPPLAALEVLLRVGDAGEMRLPARLTVATGETLCVELAPDARGDVALWVEQLCGDLPADPDADRAVRLLDEATDAVPDGAVVEVAAAAPAAAPALEPEEPDGAATRAARAAAASAALPIARRIDLMSVAERIHLAQHGERDARGILSRDRAGSVQCALVRNPRMGADEIITLARNPQLAVDCAEALVQHPTHGRSPEVAFALCRNPRTPLPLVNQLIPRLSQNDLRALAKGLGVRTQVAMAARKRLFNT
ncbi:MAG: hypothetical protein HY906_16875 [Deltaproteobacteria bacterium]|nr:hypothetical protein [Deltaproteobacteria bacterium]